MGQVKTENALVYKEASFDAKVIAELSRGESFPISQKTFGPFYKIKVTEGVYGFVSEVDIEPVLSDAEKKKKKEKEKQDQEKAREERKAKRPFEYQNWRGFEIAQITYREDTMGMKPSDSMTFFGFKFSGPKTLLEGSYTDTNLLMHFGAPRFYEEATGQSANGFILIADVMFQTALPQGKDGLMVFGFGPMLKYSSYNLGLKMGAREESYSATDLNLGAVFNIGYAHRFGGFALRGEFKYFWEKVTYSGFTLSGQLPF